MNSALNSRGVSLGVLPKPRSACHLLIANITNRFEMLGDVAGASENRRLNHGFVPHRSSPGFHPPVFRQAGAEFWFNSSLAPNIYRRAG